MIPVDAAPVGVEDRCAVEGGLPVGPVAAGLWDGELGSARPVCARTEVAVAPRGLLLVDTPAFYGRILGVVALEGSVVADADTALWLRLEPLRVDNVIGAIPSSAAGIGFTTLGVTQRLDDGGPTAVAFAGEAVLPTAIKIQGNAAPVGANVAFAVDHAAGPWSAHAQLGWVGSASLSPGPFQLRTGFAATGGGVWRPGRAFAAVLDLQAAVSYTATFDHLAVAPAVRFGAGPVGIELGGAVPVAGRERALAVAELRVSVRR